MWRLAVVAIIGACLFAGCAGTEPDSFGTIVIDLQSVEFDSPTASQYSGMVTICFSFKQGPEIEQCEDFKFESGTAEPRAVRVAVAGDDEEVSSFLYRWHERESSPSPRATVYVNGAELDADVGFDTERVGRFVSGNIGDVRRAQSCIELNECDSVYLNPFEYRIRTSLLITPR